MTFPKRIPVESWSADTSLETPKFITFDAYNTLYAIGTPMMELYSNAVAEYGVKVEPEVLTRNFGAAYRKVNNLYPNYGRDSGITSEEWWKIMVREVFAPLELSSKAIDNVLATFSTHKTYFMYPDLPELLEMLHVKYPNTILGIISNADPIFFNVVKGFELDKYFKDNLYISYELGYGKPSKEIFDYAIEDVLRKHPELLEGTSRDDFKKYCWHIGDEKVNDMEAPVKAGWYGFLLDRGNKFGFFDREFKEKERDIAMHKIDHDIKTSWETGIAQTDTIQLSERELVLSNLKTLEVILNNPKK
ncbi:Uncharacterized protein RNJ44_04439 [Nakaseomyces bracarensis]|uniref:Haloacid dehalogenase-like hydrolase n=1 Tax=Nakaseomyces bracarensis TaxID=273131 RepID=A0ABR4NV06_9SACH